MTRQIQCATCVEELRRFSRDPEAVAAGEQLDVVTGAALYPYVCDTCNAQLPPGTTCHAVTITTPEQRPYREWAPEYVALEVTS